MNRLFRGLILHNRRNCNQIKLLFERDKIINKSLFSNIDYNTYQTKETIFDEPNKEKEINNGNNIKRNTNENINDLFKAVDIKPTVSEDVNIGEELTGKLNKDAMQKILMDFYRTPQVKTMATEVGLTEQMFKEAFKSFRRYCIQSASLPVELHVKLSDIVKNQTNVSDLFPYFLKHTRDMFPHLVCMEELKQISNLTEPAEWYADARKIQRKIIYHAGPTNSGKTYTALEEFKKSASGIYCGPLKLLANEIAQKTNDHSPICDMITGDERRYIKENGEPSTHVSCTVEMSDINREFDVAIIDEIQMISDSQRGWAWTRAFLGLRAKEIHLCGDRSAADLIEDLCFITNDEFELREYKRLSKLTICHLPLNSLRNVRAGDCIVCFNKNDIFYTVRQLEQLGHLVAVIYGSMPPIAKYTQAKRFNDPDDPCKILVATDAIGMGLNLNIRRIVFSSIKKPSLIEEDNVQGYITTSQALQIAGRAGRFNSEFPDGEVTTLRQEDLPVLREILNKPIDTIAKAGLHPTADQIELFAYQLPNHPLSRLIEIFENICQVDNSKYFLCELGSVKFIAGQLEHIELPLKVRYILSISPINAKSEYVCKHLVKFARSYSRGEPITVSDVDKMVEWPCKLPNNLKDLLILESIFDVFDLYMWLSYRLGDMFPDVVEIRNRRTKLDHMIMLGIERIIKAETFSHARSIDKKDTNEKLNLNINTEEMSNENNFTKPEITNFVEYMKKNVKKIPKRRRKELLQHELHKTDQKEFNVLDTWENFETKVNKGYLNKEKLSNEQSENDDKESHVLPLDKKILEAVKIKDWVKLKIKRRNSDFKPIRKETNDEKDLIEQFESKQEEVEVEKLDNELNLEIKQTNSNTESNNNGFGERIKMKIFDRQKLKINETNE